MVWITAAFNCRFRRLLQKNVASLCKWNDVWRPLRTAGPNGWWTSGDLKWTRRVKVWVDRLSVEQMENRAAKTWWQLCAIFAGPTAAEGEVRHQREMLRRFQVMTNKTKQTTKTTRWQHMTKITKTQSNNLFYPAIRGNVSDLSFMVEKVTDRN